MYSGTHASPGSRSRERASVSPRRSGTAPHPVLAAGSEERHGGGGGGGGFGGKGGRQRSRPSVMGSGANNGEDWSGPAPDSDRRLAQRRKQITFGFITDGYKNMIRLLESDPLLKSGGVLPLLPPEIDGGTKRSWDIKLRKWRRALHMFDYVFIDGVDEDSKRAEVEEEQRQQWVSVTFAEQPKDKRVRVPLEALLAARSSPHVPQQIPVEEDLKCVLRSESCYQPLSAVVPQGVSALTKGTAISPLEVGVKIHIAPSEAVLRQQAEQQLQRDELQRQLRQRESVTTEGDGEVVEAGHDSERDRRKSMTRGKSQPRLSASSGSRQSPLPHHQLPLPAARLGSSISPMRMRQDGLSVSSPAPRMPNSEGATSTNCTSPSLPHRHALTMMDDVMVSPSVRMVAATESHPIPPTFSSSPSAKPPMPVHASTPLFSTAPRAATTSPDASRASPLSDGLQDRAEGAGALSGSYDAAAAAAAPTHGVTLLSSPLSPPCPPPPPPHAASPALSQSPPLNASPPPPRPSGEFPCCVLFQPPPPLPPRTSSSSPPVTVSPAPPGPAHQPAVAATAAAAAGNGNSGVASVTVGGGALPFGFPYSYPVPALASTSPTQRCPNAAAASSSVPPGMMMVPTPFGFYPAPFLPPPLSAAATTAQASQSTLPQTHHRHHTAASVYNEAMALLATAAAMAVSEAQQQQQQQQQPSLSSQSPPPPPHPQLSSPPAPWQTALPMPQMTRGGPSSTPNTALAKESAAPPHTSKGATAGGGSGGRGESAVSTSLSSPPPPPPQQSPLTSLPSSTAAAAAGAAYYPLPMGPWSMSHGNMSRNGSAAPPMFFPPPPPTTGTATNANPAAAAATPYFPFPFPPQPFSSTAHPGHPAEQAAAAAAAMAMAMAMGQSSPSSGNPMATLSPFFPYASASPTQDVLAPYAYGDESSATAAVANASSRPRRGGGQQRRTPATVPRFVAKLEDTRPSALRPAGAAPPLPQDADQHSLHAPSSPHVTSPSSAAKSPSASATAAAAVESAVVGKTEAVGEEECGRSPERALFSGEKDEESMLATVPRPVPPSREDREDSALARTPTATCTTAPASPEKPVTDLVARQEWAEMCSIWGTPSS